MFRSFMGFKCSKPNKLQKQQKLSRSRSTISNCRSPTSQISNKINFNKDSNNLELDEDYRSFKIETNKVNKATISIIKENQIQTEEINKLNNEINNTILKNFEIKKKIQKELAMRKKYEDEQRKVAEFCNDLNFKFRHEKETLGSLENIVYDLEKENRKITENYDKKIADIDNENQKLQKRIKDREELYKIQLEEIAEKSAKMNGLNTDINRQNDLFNERVELHKKKFDNLKKKYEDMLKKMIAIQIEFNENNNDERRNKKNLSTIQEKKTVEEIEKQIETCEQNNDELTQEINSLNKQYKQISSYSGRSGGLSALSTFKSTNFLNGTNDTKNK